MCESVCENLSKTYQNGGTCAGLVLTTSQGPLDFFLKAVCDQDPV
jgi:hypothetical protein